MRLFVLGIMACGLVLAGCGEREIEPPLAPVELVVDAPADSGTVDDETVEVRGRVTPPDATVRVNGDQVGVQGGAFSTIVALEGGTNVIDVQAGAPRRPAAMTAVRVVRLVLVEVPDLEGFDPDVAADTLTGLGLQPDLQDVGSLLDELVGGDPSVCGTDPEEGREVEVGTSVTVGYARAC